MTIFVALALTILTFLAVILPFFRQKTRMGYVATDEQSQELLFKRDTTYAMLKELEFDYKAGVLTEEDYRDLEGRYKRKGVSILKDIDSLPKNPGIDADIETQVSRLRRKQPADMSDEIEAKISSLRQNKARFCSQCGTGHRADAIFCANCGAKLN